MRLLNKSKEVIKIIQNYLISTCLFIIDDFNDAYSNIKGKQLKQIADRDFCEADLVVKLGYPFRQKAHFNLQGTGHDIIVRIKDFIIEVKYLRNFKSGESGNFCANKIMWKDAFEKDFKWLCDEIKKGEKGKRAFILGWFNAVERFSEIMQLGQGRGAHPGINESRLRLFPFLNHNPESERTEDIFYMYKSAYKPLPIQILGYDRDTVDCMFFGKPEDKFHFAMYC